MRQTEDNKPTHNLRSKRAEFPRTFVPDKWEWAGRYVNSSDLKTFSEEEILADLPERDPRIDQSTRSRAQTIQARGQSYEFHPERLQRPQTNHLFRQMNLLRKKAAETNDQSLLEMAWQIRQQLAGEFFWIVEDILDAIQNEYPSEDLSRVSDHILEKLYSAIDDFDPAAGVHFNNFSRPKILAYAFRVLESNPRGELSPKNLPGSWWEKREYKDDEKLSQEIMDTFWRLIYKKVAAYQVSDIPGSKPISQAPLAEILYVRFAEGNTLPEIGRAMGFTKERARQLISLALGYVREIALRDPEVQAFLQNLGMGVESEEDVNLLINRVRYRPRTGPDKPRRSN